MSAAVPVTPVAHIQAVDVEQELGEIMTNPQEWLDTPNDRFEGRPPRALIHTSEEQRLRDLIGSVKHGLGS